MTYVEFFDKTSSENITSCLTFVPDRVVFIGDNSKLMKKHIANYKKVFEARGQKIEFLYRTVTKSNLDKIVQSMSHIVEKYDDCVFDITGGDEMLTFALGIVYSKYPDKNIQIHKFNLKNNTIVDCDKDGKTIYMETPTLSIDENIRIYGGEVSYGAINESKTYIWDMNPDFCNDIQLIWDVCKGDVRYWNTQVWVFETIESVGHHSDNNLVTVASRTAVENLLKKHKSNYIISKGIILYLLKNGLLTHFEEDEQTISIAYKNEQVKKCLTKAGQALEMKIYLTAKNVLDDDCVPVYDDALNGVVIDWDGVFHDEKSEKEYDTENEIDIMLMHDVVPVFISCKNGLVTADELYKLNTVAERFGAQYSKKILVATSISDMGVRGEYLRQRATDMGINIIENVQSMTEAELEKKIKNLWRG